MFFESHNFFAPPKGRMLARQRLIWQGEFIQAGKSGARNQETGTKQPHKSSLVQPKDVVFVKSTPESFSLLARPMKALIDRCAGVTFNWWRSKCRLHPMCYPKRSWQRLKMAKWWVGQEVGLHSDTLTSFSRNTTLSCWFLERVVEESVAGISKVTWLVNRSKDLLMWHLDTRGPPSQHGPHIPETEGSFETRRSSFKAKTNKHQRHPTGYKNDPDRS